MTVLEILTPTNIALGVNTIALVVVCYQTFLTRRALDAARRSIDDSRKTRQLELLPRAGWVIEVRYRLEKWRDDLQESIKLLEVALPRKDGAVLKRIAEESPKIPKGIVPRYAYDHAPDWLKEILISGARYYYNAKVLMAALWSTEKDEPWFDLGRSVIERSQESIEHISRWLAFIEDMVPESYLEEPARLRDEDYVET